MPLPLAGAHRDNMREVLKDFYMPVVRNQLNEDVMLWSRLEPDPDAVSGKQCIVALRTRRHEGHGATPVGATTLPSPGRQGYAQTSFLWATYYARIQVDGTLSAADRDSAGAFLDVFNAEVQNLAVDVRSEYNRQANMDGSGRLGVITNITGRVITVRHPLDVADQGEFLQYIREGMSVMIYDPTDSTTATPFAWSINSTSGQRHFYVGAVNPEARSFQLYSTEDAALAAGTGLNPAAGGDFYDAGGNVALRTGSVIVRCTLRSEVSIPTTTAGYRNYSGYIGHRGQTGVSTFLGLSGRKPVEMMGIAGLVSNADLFDGFNGGTEITAGLQNLSVATAPYWRANVLQNSGVKRPITLNLMQRAIDYAELQGNGMISIISGSYGVRRAIISMLIANQRYTGGEEVLNLRGGFKAISFDGYPIIKDKDACPGRLYFLDEARLGVALARDFHYLDDDGAILSRLDDNNEFQAAMGHFAEVYTDRRNAHSVITDITEG